MIQYRKITKGTCHHNERDRTNDETDRSTATNSEMKLFFGVGFAYILFVLKPIPCFGLFTVKWILTIGQMRALDLEKLFHLQCIITIVKTKNLFETF